MQGYLVVGYGWDYLVSATNLAHTLTLHGDQRPIAVIVKEGHEQAAIDSGKFAHVFVLGPKPDALTLFEHAGIIGRIQFLDQLPFTECLLLDSDILCQSSTNHIWELFTKSNQPICTVGKELNNTWHWDTITSLRSNLGLSLPECQGGIIYLHKGHPEYPGVITNFNYALEHYDELGFLRKYGNEQSMTEEIIWSYVVSKLNITPFSFKDYPLMTFNPCCQSPANLYEEFDKKDFKLFKEPIPFVHISWKLNDIIYARTFYKIIQRNAQWDQAEYWLALYGHKHEYEALLQNYVNTDEEQLITRTLDWININ